jgi:hypothetical protein
MIRCLRRHNEESASLFIIRIFRPCTHWLFESLDLVAREQMLVDNRYAHQRGVK